MLEKVRWAYLPRAANKVADYLAGVASDDARAQHRGGGVALDAAPPRSLGPDVVFHGLGCKALELGFEILVPASEHCKAVFYFLEVCNLRREVANTLRWIQLNPKHQNLCFAYLASVAANQGGIMVPYAPRSEDDRGRLYGFGNCIFGQKEGINFVACFFEQSSQLSEVYGNGARRGTDNLKSQGVRHIALC